MRAFDRDIISKEYLGAGWKYIPAQTLLHRCASRALVAAIALYQAYLSPLKGFSCAHRTLHHGPSCSQFVKQAIAAGGCMAGWTALKLRATKCREALAILRSEEHTGSNENTGETKSDWQNGRPEKGSSLKSCLQVGGVDCTAGCCILPFSS